MRSSSPPLSGDSVANIAAYRFVGISNCHTVAENIRSQAQALGLRGTVLVAPEGINLFLAAPRQAIDGFLAWLGEDARFADLTIKWSESAYLPFQRLRVKVKQEIITLRLDGFDPAQAPAPYLAPEELKRWLDEGRDVVLLDTRNEWEVAAGTFDTAIDPHVLKFSEFIARLADFQDLKTRTVVTFCTGGIRCEKAAPLMKQHGFDQVWQLDGGILNYFEKCGGAHWHGQCVVFDERGALNPDLTPARPQP